MSMHSFYLYWWVACSVGFAQRGFSALFCARKLSHSKGVYVFM
ncbi:hypothetical protein RchiOBHm_Chr1g0313021 [Rosa chinensis]|uniref:Uncharacterized protein n=1 Tax=Rosa chinensis TaxID=74649 RepID=A0A2P6S6X2_ROSCH|nr:hypothetical protein RchiOBHm_Chr1g0313021 [Rosa chinensis]